MKWILALLLCLSLEVAAAPAEGDRVPDFSMQGSDGNTYSRQNLAGEPFVIAFFPKAFTGG